MMTAQDSTLRRFGRASLSTAALVAALAATALGPTPAMAQMTPAASDFVGVAEPLPDAVRARMVGVSWREGCPVPLEELSYLTLSYVDFAGAVQQGEMVVAAAVANDVIEAFRQMFVAGFPIASMRLVDDFAADDDASMAANNTSAFNCRQVTGGTRFSEHSYGRAIDINTIQNPYVSGTLVLPPEGAAFVDRTVVQPGMIVEGDAVTAAFAAIGWAWGGNYQTLKDYQHFSLTGG